MGVMIHLDESLLTQVEQIAASRGQTPTAFVENAVRELLARSGQRQHERVRLVTSGRGGLQPGVNLDSSAALWDLLDETDDPS
jgi:Arc/MetJ family transcription regulator